MRAHWVVFAICTACGGKLDDQRPSPSPGPGDSGADAAAMSANGGIMGAGGAVNVDASIAGKGGSSSAGGSAQCPPASFQYDGPQKTKDVDGCTRVVLQLPSHVIDGACYLPFPPGADETVQYASSWAFSMAGIERQISFSRRAGDGPCTGGMTPDAYGWIPHDCSSVELCAYNFCPMFLYDDRVVDVVMPCGWSLPP